MMSSVVYVVVALMLMVDLIISSPVDFARDNRRLRRQSPRRIRRELTQLEWSSCATSPSVFQLKSLELTPMPIEIPGTLYISLEASSNRTIENMEVDVHVEKHLWGGFSVPIPCVAGIGSCTIDDACAMAEVMRADETSMVKSFVRLMDEIGVAKTCPLTPMSISVTRFPIDLTEIPAILGLLSNGEYTARVKFREANTSPEVVLGCYEFHIELTAAGMRDCWWCG